MGNIHDPRRFGGKIILGTVQLLDVEGNVIHSRELEPEIIIGEGDLITAVSHDVHVTASALDDYLNDDPGGTHSLGLGEGYRN